MRSGSPLRKLRHAGVGIRPERGRGDPARRTGIRRRTGTARSRDAGSTAPWCTSAGTPAGAATAAGRRIVASLSYSARRDPAFPRPIAARSREMRCATMSRWRTSAPRCCPTWPSSRSWAAMRAASCRASSRTTCSGSSGIPACWRPPAIARAACSRPCGSRRTATTCCSCCIARWRHTLVAQLSAFVLRADVRFEDRSRLLEVAGLLDAEPDARWSQPAAAAAGLAMLVASPRRILLAGTRPALDAALAAIPRTTPEDWDLRLHRWTASRPSCRRPPRCGCRRC